MKQIKTIKTRLDNAAIFDKDVNAALADGWQLKKREVLIPMAQNDRCTVYTMLYAELEKEVITEEERCCENCKHSDKDSNERPCCECNDGVKYPTKWEEAEG